MKNENDKEELKDVGLGGAIKETFKKPKEKKKLVEKIYENQMESKALSENDEYSGVKEDVRDSTNGALPITIAINSVATIAGPAALLFVVDLNPEQFKIMLTLILTNAFVNIVATFMHYFNNKSVSKNVGKAVFYRLSGKSKSDVVEKQMLKDENTRLKERLEETRNDKEELEKFRLDKAVKEELKKRGVTNERTIT